jgi:hypothetical protein
MVLADRIPVVHGVESRNLVYSHGRHFQYPRNLIHNTNATESVLALSEIEERHDCSLFVLRGVPGHDFLDELLILRCELERDIGVVLGRVAMLQARSTMQLYSRDKYDSTYDIERAALIECRARNAEGPPLGPLELSEGPWGTSVCEWYQS